MIKNIKMTHKEAVKLVTYWQENEPNKFQAWTWYGRGLKEAERWQILKGKEDLNAMPFGKAVAEFQEHWRYDQAEILAELTRLDQEMGLYDEDPYFHLADSETIGGIINRTETTEFKREDHPDSAEARHMRVIKPKKK